MKNLFHIEILRETGDWIAISKPSDISVHEGAGDNQYTIVDWLKENRPEILKYDWLSKIRPGIVHRLDKDTTGILLLAKNPQTLEYLQNQFRERKIEKHYTALVCGKPHAEKGSINVLLRRDPKDRERQKAQLLDFGLDEAERKNSTTDYKIIGEYEYKNNSLALLDVVIHTGRKHQIRAHMKFENIPVLGDQKYFNKLSRRLSKELGNTRQMLHAASLKFKDKKGECIEVRDNLPEDFQEIIKKFKIQNEK